MTISWCNYIEYDETSPSFLRWTKTVGRGGSLKNAGDVVGSVCSFGKLARYWRFGLDKKTYFNHRVIWQMFNGEILNGLVINHIDNNPLNNKISNLELVTTKANNQKTYVHNGLGLGSKNTSGFVGMHDSIREINGKIYCYIHAQFHDAFGKKIQKHFRYEISDKVSKEKALESAIEWRRNNLKELVDQGLAFYNKEKL